jgi:hypothetical protein
MYDSPIRSVTDAIIVKHGLNGPRKSWACDKAPNRFHGLHQLCVDRENEPWFNCTCKCHEGRITVRPASDPEVATNTGRSRKMPALYISNDTDRKTMCKAHLTGEQAKAGRPPANIDRDGIRWTHLTKDEAEFRACVVCHTA